MATFLQPAQHHRSLFYSSELEVVGETISDGCEARIEEFLKEGKVGLGFVWIWIENDAVIAMFR